MNRQGYPNNDGGKRTQSPYNIKKWIEAIGNIYAQTPFVGFEQAYFKITENWGQAERMDFKRWWNYYQQDNHMKYKLAQYIDFNSLKAQLPEPLLEEEVSVKEISKRRAKSIQELIQSLVMRLNSAERIATNPEVVKALNNRLKISFEEWLNLLHRLKREIQLMRSANLLNEIVYKHAHRVALQGDRKAAAMLLKIAQMEMVTPGDSLPMNPVNVPMAGQPLAPNSAPGPGAQMPGEPEKNDAVSEFLKNLNNDDIFEADDEDKLEVNDEDDLESNDLIITAQEFVPPQPNTQTAGERQQISDDIFDKALEGVRVQDIVARLEGIAKLFKNRQIARELAIIDLMMDKVGIAPFFPSLAEAMKSALESNQYCQSRVEEILAKLRGTLTSSISRQMENDVKVQLEHEEENEEAAQAFRRQQQKKEVLQPEMPANQVQKPSPPPAATIQPMNELAGPVQVQPSPPIPRPGT